MVGYPPHLLMCRGCGGYWNTGVYLTGIRREYFGAKGFGHLHGDFALPYSGRARNDYQRIQPVPRNLFNEYRLLLLGYQTRNLHHNVASLFHGRNRHELVTAMEI